MDYLSDSQLTTGITRNRRHGAFSLVFKDSGGCRVEAVVMDATSGAPLSLPA